MNFTVQMKGKYAFPPKFTPKYEYYDKYTDYCSTR